MQIKIPAAYDTSHWQTVPDFALIEPRPALVITKATEADNFTDSTFLKYFADLKQDGILRGAYHFHRKFTNPITQAEHFVKTISPVLETKDILALDIEEGGETAAQIIAWLDYVQAQFSNLMLIYSRKNILDPIPMTESQKTRLKQIPIWTAGYPWFPDLFSVVPAGYIPDQTKWGPVYLWQYGKQILPGAGETDVNWISPAFYQILFPPTPPTGNAYPARVVLQYENKIKGYIPE